MTFVVEVIPPYSKQKNWKTAGVMKEFSSRRQADMFAQKEYAKGNGVSLDRILRDGDQASVLQRGMKRTALFKHFKNKYGMNNDYGKFTVKVPKKTLLKVQKAPVKKPTTPRKVNWVKKLLPF